MPGKDKFSKVHRFHPILIYYGMGVEEDGDAGRWGTRERRLGVEGLQESRTVMEESNKGKMKGCEGEGACWPSVQW